MLASGGHFDPESKQKKLKELEEKSQAQGFWDDQRKASKVTKEMDLIRNQLNNYQSVESRLEEVKTILDLADEGGDELLAEAPSILDSLEKNIEKMEFQKMLSGEHDVSSAILTINAGAGGTEACDWVNILLRMYRRWCDLHNYKNEVVDFTSGDEAGFRSVTVTIEGDYSYGYLKAEIGVHRLVRISPFDANKRRHTSFASVFVIPEVDDDIEIEIKPDDLRIDTFRAGGAGGQHVNTTDSAVRVTHIPSGIAVACQNQRSQHQNKETAMRLLKSKLYELEMEKKQKELDKIEQSKKKIEWGSQIRSYVLQPYQMIKDHRTNLEIGNTQAVLDGEIDPFIRTYLLSEES